MKRLRKENFLLRRANAILKNATVYFARSTSTQPSMRSGSRASESAPAWRGVSPATYLIFVPGILFRPWCRTRPGHGPG